MAYSIEDLQKAILQNLLANELVSRRLTPVTQERLQASLTMSEGNRPVTGTLRYSELLQIRQLLGKGVQQQVSCNVSRPPQVENRSLQAELLLKQLVYQLANKISRNKPDENQEPTEELTLEVLKYFIGSKIADLGPDDPKGVLELLQLLVQVLIEYPEKKKEIADYLAEISYASLITQHMGQISVLNVLDCEDASTLSNCALCLCLNLSACSAEFAKGLARDGAVELLTQIITNEEYLLNGAKQEIVSLISSSVDVLNNIARHVPTKTCFKQQNTAKALEHIITWNNGCLEVRAMLTLALVMDDEQLLALTDDNDIIKRIVDWLNKACDNKEDRSHDGFSPCEIAESLTKLAANDFNKAKIIMAGGLQALTKMLCHSDPSEQINSAVCVKTIAQDVLLRPIIVKVTELLVALLELGKSSNEDVLFEGLCTLLVLADLSYLKSDQERTSTPVATTSPPEPVTTCQQPSSSQSLTAPQQRSTSLCQDAHFGSPPQDRTDFPLWEASPATHPVDYHMEKLVDPQFVVDYLIFRGVFSSDDQVVQEILGNSNQQEQTEALRNLVFQKNGYKKYLEALDYNQIYVVNFKAIIQASIGNGQLKDGRYINISWNPIEDMLSNLTLKLKEKESYTPQEAYGYQYSLILIQHLFSFDLCVKIGHFLTLLGFTEPALNVISQINREDVLSRSNSFALTSATLNSCIAYSDVSKEFVKCLVDAGFIETLTGHITDRFFLSNLNEQSVFALMTDFLTLLYNIACHLDTKQSFKDYKTAEAIKNVPVKNKKIEITVMLTLLHSLDEQDLHKLPDASNIIENIIKYMSGALLNKSTRRYSGMSLCELTKGLTVLAINSSNRSKIASKDEAVAVLANMLRHNDPREHISSAMCLQVLAVERTVRRKLLEFPDLSEAMEELQKSQSLNVRKSVQDALALLRESTVEDDSKEAVSIGGQAIALLPRDSNDEHFKGLSGVVQQLARSVNQMQISSQLTTQGSHPHANVFVVFQSNSMTNKGTNVAQAEEKKFTARGKSEKLRPEDEQTIKRHWKLLIEQLDATHLIFELISYGVFDVDDKREIMDHASRRKRTEIMLQKLLNAGPGPAFKRFIDVLEKDHGHIVDRLREWVHEIQEDPPAVRLHFAKSVSQMQISSQRRSSRTKGSHQHAFNSFVVNQSNSVKEEVSEDLIKVEKRRSSEDYSDLSLESLPTKMPDTTKLAEVSEISGCQSEEISQSHPLTVLVEQLKELWDGIQKLSGNKLTIEMKSYAVTFEELTSLITTCLGGLHQVDIVIDGTKQAPLEAEVNTDVTRLKMEALVVMALIEMENEKLLVTLEKKQEASRHTEDVNRIFLNLKTVASVTAEITEYLLKSTIVELKSEPTLSEIVKLSQDIKSQENLNLNERHTLTEADIFCKLLGLNHEIGEMLWSLDESYHCHQTTLYFIERWMDNADDEETGAASGASTDMSTEKREKFISIVQHLGLTKETAEQLVSTIPIEYIDLQTPSYWIMRYITNTIESHPVFTNVSRYIYSEDTIGEWFKENIELTESNEMRDTSTFKIKMINHDSSEKSQTAVNAFVEEILTEENCEVLFHGTDHTSAKSILEEGILISKGKLCQDFSSNDGFYLSDSYEKAREWSSIGIGHHHAVLVFKIETSVLEADGVKRLDLFGDKKQWEEIVQFCRKGCSDQRTKRRLLGGVEFIKGPMCLNARDVAKGKKPTGFGRTENYQICIRDEDYAKMFGMIENIAGVIFL